MSLEDINDAAGAQNALTAAINGFMTTVDADIATRQAAYAALANDLKGVVNSQMYFTATIDPDDVAPTNIDGGVFNTIVAAVNVSPAGSFVTLSLMADKTHVLTNVNTNGRSIEIKRTGVGDNPIIEPEISVTATHNAMAAFRTLGATHISFSSVEINLPNKLDPLLPWSESRSIIHYGYGAVVFLRLSVCTVTTAAGNDGVGIVSTYIGGISHVGIYASTFDGPLSVVISATNGAAVIGKYSATLTNGATLTDGGTVGVNILQN